MKRLLLDTHVLIWWLRDAPELGPKSRTLIADRKNKVFVSAASLWEMQIKRNIGKLRVPDGLFGIVEEACFLVLPINGQHAEQTGALPHHHRDPFDRMIVAQAQVEGLEIITADAQIPRYSVSTINAKR